MRVDSSAITRSTPPLPPPAGAGTGSGAGWAFTGVLAFSLSVPLTRVAVRDLDGVFVGTGRAVLAGLLAVLLLAATRQPLPAGRQWPLLAVVAGGVVLGFPVLASVALRSVPASHAAVTIAILPAATAVAAVARTRERLPLRFWGAVAAGALATLLFAARAAPGPAGVHVADLLLLAAVAAGAVGYAEGAHLARALGAWQTICWSLVVALPVTVLAAATVLPRHPGQVGAAAWASFGYLGVVSMFLGFFAWYRGLAIGPVAQLSQTQLVQPVLSLGWSALLLGERIGPGPVAGAVAVVGCAGVAVRTRAATAPPQPGAGRPPRGRGRRGAGLDPDTV